MLVGDSTGAFVKLHSINEHRNVPFKKRNFTLIPKFVLLLFVLNLDWKNSSKIVRTKEQELQQSDILCLFHAKQ